MKFAQFTNPNRKSGGGRKICLLKTVPWPETTTRRSAATIDLRSDTVTRPTPAMRAAMAAAEVGDDVYGEDPTVNRLKHAQLRSSAAKQRFFVPTGTMGNQIAIACTPSMARR